jgi:glycosyltransferase involved in cell wall biosynthesis
VGLFDALRFPFRRRPDLVHVHTSDAYSFARSSFYVLFASLVWRRPVVLHVHGSSYDEFVATDSWLLAAYQRLVYRRCTRIVVLSAIWAARLSTVADPEKLAVVPNAIDPSRFSPDGVDGPPRVVFVSNLIERKGVPAFLDALAALPARTDARYAVDIAGRGPLADRVSAAAEADHVSYHGYVDEATKVELLEAGSVFVLPSHAEGLPIAILEAMAAGNAVVSTPVGSIPEVLSDGHGCLVEPGAGEELADTLAELVEHPERAAAMGHRNRERVRERYSWERVAAELRRLYEDCTAEPTTPRTPG